MALFEPNHVSHNFQDLTGKEFGRLTPLAYVGNRKWLCQCKCGKQKVVYSSNLTGGKTVSCGCYRNQRIRETCGKLKHLHPAEYKTWCGVKRRCLNPKEESYKHYGEAGITICDEWRDSFEAFFTELGPKPSPSHTIDRINNELGYQPGNCRWATRREQAQNTRQATTLTYNSVTKPTPDWAREYGLRLQTLHDRLNRGWEVERALKAPVATNGYPRPRRKVK